MQKENPEFLVIILISSSFIFLFGGVTFLIIIKYFKRKKELILEKEIQESQIKEIVLQAQLEMQEHTFKIISQEIHDNVGQILSLAKINLNVITIEQSENESYHRIKDLVTNAIRELRDLGTGYYADRLVEEGLVSSIRHQLTQLSKTGLFITSFQSEIESVIIEKNKIIFLHRMVQEVLNNIVKHSKADKVNVKIFNKDDLFHISIEDNGKGFTRTATGFKPGIGLSSIEQRATMIGAVANINSTPGSGTIVTFSFK